MRRPHVERHHACSQCGHNARDIRRANVCSRIPHHGTSGTRGVACTSKRCDRHCQSCQRRFNFVFAVAMADVVARGTRRRAAGPRRVVCRVRTFPDGARRGHRRADRGLAVGAGRAPADETGSSRKARRGRRDGAPAQARRGGAGRTTGPAAQGLRGHAGCRGVRRDARHPDVPAWSRPEGFEFQAGQFLTVRLRADGNEHVRCYSISSPPGVPRPSRDHSQAHRAGVRCAACDASARLDAARPPTGRLVHLPGQRRSPACAASPAASVSRR